MVSLSRLDTLFHLKSQPLDMRFAKHGGMSAGNIDNFQFRGIILPTGR